MLIIEKVMLITTKPQKLRKQKQQARDIRAFFPRGEFAKSLQDYSTLDANANYRSNPHLKVFEYDEETHFLTGINPFVVSRQSELLEDSGRRTAIPSDDQFGKISALIKGKFYTIFNSPILLTSGQNDYKINDNIARDLTERVEDRRERLPAMIVNPIVENWPEDSENYGLRYGLNSKSLVISDPRLNVRYNGWRFDKVDEFGLPLFSRNGKRTWHIGKEGISYLLLDYSLDLYASGVAHALSFNRGRIICVKESK